MNVTFVRPLVGLVAGLSFAIATAAASADDGKRAVNVPRFGVFARVPQAWDLVDWSRDDVAFVLDLPQDAGSLVGHLRCTLTPVPESLEVLSRRFADEMGKSGGTTVVKPVLNEITPLVAPQTAATVASAAGRRLITEAMFQDKQGRRWGERRVSLVTGGLLYRFTLDSDEAHFEAYVADFEEMFATLRLEPPQLGVEPVGGGYWTQRDLGFALQLPESWRPTLGPNNRTLLYAAGRRHGTLVDNLSVRAAPSQPLNLEQLKTETPGLIRAADPAARVVCRIVPQRRGAALETEIRTERDGERIVILERRFTGRGGNYELRVTCAAGEFDLHEVELRRALDSFFEADATAAEQT